MKCGKCKKDLKDLKNIHSYQRVAMGGRRNGDARVYCSEDCLVLDVLEKIPAPEPVVNSLLDHFRAFQKAQEATDTVVDKKDLVEVDPPGYVRPKNISICSGHQEYQVPMIWTFAFPGAELWCPYCGHGTGSPFGDDVEVAYTDLLGDRQKAYKKFTEEFLDAVSTLSCSQTEWKGEMIAPIDLPDEEKVRLKEISENWKYKIVVEAVGAGVV